MLKQEKIFHKILCRRVLKLHMNSCPFYKKKIAKSNFIVSTLKQEKIFQKILCKRVLKVHMNSCPFYQKKLLKAFFAAKEQL